MISEVYYHEIDENVCNSMSMGEFYFFHNLTGLTDELDNAYENYERRQLSLRNQLIRDAIERGDIPNHPKINTIVFGLSSLLDKPIIMIEC